MGEKNQNGSNSCNNERDKSAESMRRRTSTSLWTDASSTTVAPLRSESPDAFSTSTKERGREMEEKKGMKKNNNKKKKKSEEKIRPWKVRTQSDTSSTPSFTTSSSSSSFIISILISSALRIVSCGTEHKSGQQSALEWSSDPQCSTPPIRIDP